MGRTKEKNQLSLEERNRAALLTVKDKLLNSPEEPKKRGKGREKKNPKLEGQELEQPEIKNAVEQKADGAVIQIDKTVELNSETEAGLGQELEISDDFTEQAEKINLLRNLVAGVAEYTINKETENTKKAEKSNDKVEQARIELEKKITDPFARVAYDKLADRNKTVLLGYLIKEGIKPEKSQIVKMERVTWADQNVVHFSDNGYLMKLTNKKEIAEKGKKLDVENEKALYMLVSPDDQIIARDLHYNVALSTLEKKAESYHIKLNKEFSGEGEVAEPNSEIVLTKKEIQDWIKIIEENGDTEEDLKVDETFIALVPRQQKILLRVCQELNKKLDAEPFTAEEFKNFFDTIKGSTISREDVIETSHFKMNCTKSQKKEVLDHFDKKGTADAAVGRPKDIPEADALSKEEFTKYFDEIRNQNTARDAVITDDKFKNNCNNDQKREILKHFDKPVTAEISKEAFSAISQRVKSGELKREDLLASPEYQGLKKIRQDILLQQLTIRERADGLVVKSVDVIKNVSEEDLNDYIKIAAIRSTETVASTDWFKTLPDNQQKIILGACINPDISIVTVSDDYLNHFKEVASTRTPKTISSTDWFKTLAPKQREMVLGACIKADPTLRTISDVDLKHYLEVAEKQSKAEVSSTDWFKTLVPEQQLAILNACRKPDAEPKHQIITDENMLGFEKQIKDQRITEEELRKDATFKTLGPEQQARLLKVCEAAPKALDAATLKYSESIGIKKEEFNEFPEFLNLKPEQQKLVLETLRRSSLVLARAQGHENFDQEKGQKTWFKKIGFNFNQNYHKKRHEVEAIKSIESKGLEGYSKSEFALLINIVKNGVEVKENGAVDFLVAGRMSENVDKQLISDYNRAARTYIEFPKNTKDLYARELIHQAEKDLNNYKNEILKTASFDDMNNLREAENNIKLFNYLSANKETEEIINKLSSETLTGGRKAKMMLGAHGDKAVYMTMGVSLKTIARFSMGVNYAIAPAVAAVLGGLRAYNTNRKDINEKELFAQIGFKDTEMGTSKFSKTMNQAVGKKENGVDIGLSDKLDNLVSRFEIAQDNFKTEKDPEEIEKAKKVLDDVTSLLNHRISYTIGRINDREVSYGPAEERGINFYKLNESLIGAQAAVSYDLNPFNKVSSEVSNYKDDLGRKTTKFTRSDVNVYNVERRNGESDEKFQKRYTEMNSKLEQLKQIGFEDRLASFMGYKEDIRANKEFVYMAKKVALGAVMGATFAAAGVWVAEKLGLDVFFAQQWGSFKGLFSHHDATHVLLPGAKVPTVDTVTAKAPVAASGKNIIGTDKISNEGLHGKSDNVWRSAREVFKGKAAQLGFKGNLNDAKAVSAWADHKVDEALKHSPKMFDAKGNIRNLVTEGNEVNVLRNGDHFEIEVNRGSGLEPGHIVHHAAVGGVRHPIIGRAENEIHPLTPKSGPDQVPTDNAGQDQQMIDLKNGMDKNVAYNALEQKVLAENFKFKPENLMRISNDHFSYKIAGKGEMFFGLKDGSVTIERLTDANNNLVPISLINELKRGLSVDRFIQRGGMDKVFSIWNNLSDNSKMAYQDLISFKDHKINPSQLLNKICENFHVNANKGVMIDVETNHFILNGRRNFNMDLKGLGKLVKALAHRGS